MKKSYDDEAPISLAVVHKRQLTVDAGDQVLYMDKPLLDLESQDVYRAGTEPRPPVLLEQRSDSPKAFELIRSWLDLCTLTHETCSARNRDGDPFFSLPRAGLGRPKSSNSFAIN
jgi:hypothetical protein